VVAKTDNSYPFCPLVVSARQKLMYDFTGLFLITSNVADFWQTFTTLADFSWKFVTKFLEKSYSMS